MKKYNKDILKQKLDQLIVKHQDFQKESKILNNLLDLKNDETPSKLEEKLIKLEAKLKSKASFYTPIISSGIDSYGMYVMEEYTPARWKDDINKLKNSVNDTSKKLSIAKKLWNLNCTSAHLGILIDRFEQELKTFDPTSREAKQQLQKMKKIFEEHSYILSNKRPRNSIAKFYDSLTPARPTQTSQLIIDFLDLVEKAIKGENNKIDKPLLFSREAAHELDNSLYLNNSTL